MKIHEEQKTENRIISEDILDTGQNIEDASLSIEDISNLNKLTDE